MGNEIRTSFKTQTNFLEKGNLIGNKEGIKNVWTEYFQEL